MSRLTIGKLAARAGVGVETVRFYERKGLIACPRKAPNEAYRVYSEDVIARIRFIRQAQHLGFSLQEAQELMELRAEPAGRNATAQIHARAAAKLTEVDEKIRRLRQLRKVLRELVEKCPRAGPVQCCPIVASLDRGG
jgi:MerR family copper efflux transcriptional regulator